MVYYGMVKVAGSQLSIHFVFVLPIDMGHGGYALLCMSLLDIMGYMVVCKVALWIARCFLPLVLFRLFDMLMNLYVLSLLLKANY